MKKYRSNSEILDEVPPHDHDAERMLLAKMFVEPDIIPRVRKLIEPSMLYAVDLRAIYLAMLATYRKTKACDVAAVYATLGKHDKRLPWMRTITQLAEYMPHAGFWEDDAKSIRDCYIARQMYESLLSAIVRLYNSEHPAAVARSVRSAIAKLIPEGKRK